jgi:phosphate transport system substrate-binding protein
MIHARRAGPVLAVALWTLATATNAAEVRGTLTSAGSDTASALVTRWASAFRERHPLARIQIQAAGSGSAPIALLEGAADLGPMSRPMTKAEEDAFARRFGYPPLRVTIAHDAIAVFVHPDNPVAALTLAQVDAIFSSDRRCGAGTGVRDWRSLGGRDLAVLAVGRDTGSGTHELFREVALCDGRYRPDVVAWPGNGAVVAAVAAHPQAIGYAGLGYVNARVKPLAIARDAQEPAVAPAADAIVSGRYPLARPILIYVNRPPGAGLPALPAAFVDFALSDAGQQLVRHEGFIPLTEDERRAQRAALHSADTPP